ncbi:alpha-N-arabinofuranosidase [Streptomyces sp. 8K308]|uniref:glycoside hydrolase family 43 protein n=1 Tax=Streptomyces sp. 8K308 TaxID=2530388 RepID=UPI00104EEDB6|nr:glycoside hydrolase family 43 protein [Streptomyces sp. 8K308]TDC21581.1 alpha-N-arabinofuranosidase [Streptomyces sp. 8K308]
MALVVACAMAMLVQNGAPAAAGQAGGRTAVAADEPRPTAAFTNPIVSQNGADPWVTYYQGRYYHLGTTWASHWEIRSATTLAGLRTANPVTVYRETNASRCCNFWAPELHRLNGPNGTRWYLTYSAGVAANIDNQHVHVLESAGDNPLGPYTYRGQVDPYGDNRWMIDSSYLTMPDGRLYLLYSFWEGGTQNLYIAPLANPWTPSGRGVRISSPTHAWERSGAGVNEGPVILRRNGRTFLVYSASHCNTPDYKLGMLELVGSDPMNASSWRKFANPVFQRNDAAGVFGPGHNSFFTSPDGSETWIAYHANSSASDGCSGTRTTRAQRISWNADGTPNFGIPVANGVSLSGPSGE